MTAMKYVLAILLALAITLVTPVFLKQKNGSPFMTLTQQSALEVQTYVDAYIRIFNTLSNSGDILANDETRQDKTEIKAWRDNRGVWHFTDKSTENPAIFDTQDIEIENDANSGLYSSAANPTKNHTLSACVLMFMTFFTLSVVFMLLVSVMPGSTRD
ncbi:MAG: hypothetical protein KDI30_08000 [Pseudomonadales bacterium]|nr:hypothetical protein [Pseudomonadales bacterium]